MVDLESLQKLIEGSTKMISLCERPEREQSLALLDYAIEYAELLRKQEKPFRVVHMGVGQYHRDIRFEKITDAKKYYKDTLDPTSKIEFFGYVLL